MHFQYQAVDNKITLCLSGDFVAYDNVDEKKSFFDALLRSNVQKLLIKVDGLTSWDSSLSAFLYKTIKICQKKNVSCDYKKLPNDLKSLLDLALVVDRNPTQKQNEKMPILEDIGFKTIACFNTIMKGIHFLSDSFLSIGRFLKGKAVMRFVDFVSVLDDCGPKAVLIVSLISFMVGLILAFVGSIQLKTFGAQIYVASLVTIGMIRIMGAIMAGIIMAGRTGASYSATIGTMQVNEELDALKTMGISVIDFLVLPRILALVIAMPILVMLSDFMGMLGGAFVGTLLLDISSTEYWKYAFEAFGLTNFLVGIFHGLVFGFVISLCGCYYGVYCGRKADSVGVSTTKAVVSSIVWMIVLTGVITFFCEVFGI